jgi:hypothetical protein
MTKHTILFLAADPLVTDRLALDRETRAIQAELELSGFGAASSSRHRWPAEPLDLLRELRQLKPTVIHFRGRGILSTTWPIRSVSLSAQPRVPARR